VAERTLLEPATIYSHPWELDQDMPAFDAPWKTRQRMRRGIRGYAEKLSSVLSSFRFRPMAETAAELRFGVSEEYGGGVQ